MITEKDLLKWGFEREQGEWCKTCFIFTISRLIGPIDFVEVDIEQNGILIIYHHNKIRLSNCKTKRKADQALHLLGLPPIDKLNTIKK